MCSRRHVFYGVMSVTLIFVLMFRVRQKILLCYLKTVKIHFQCAKLINTCKKMINRKNPKLNHLFTISKVCNVRYMESPLCCNYYLQIYNVIIVRNLKLKNIQISLKTCKNYIKKVLGF